MPLHLLPKKSWHVYNAASIARVRADEAAAAAEEEAAEQRMQAVDSERRMALLRGEEPPPLPPSESEGPPGRTVSSGSKDALTPGSDRHARKRRRLRGEDETDAEMRVAREIAAEAEAARERLGQDDRGGKAGAGQDGGSNDAPLVDERGHLQLFAPPAAEGAKGPDEASERKESGHGARKKREREQKEDETMGAMRFKDAAGRGTHGQAPWYAADARSMGAPTQAVLDVSGERAKATVVLDAVQEKDVWGNADPRRRERESSRIVSNDPFAAMQRAQTQLKQSERDREAWKKERLKDVEMLGEEKTRDRKHRHRKRERERSRDGRRRSRHEDDDVQSLEGFSLDAPSKGHSGEDGSRRHRHNSSHHHHHRRRHHDH